MTGILRDGADEYCLLTWLDEEPKCPAAALGDDTGCRQLLGRVLPEPLNMTAMREVLGDVGGCGDLWQLDDHQVLDEVAWRLASGRLKLRLRDLPIPRPAAPIAGGGSAGTGPGVGTEAAATTAAAPPPVTPVAAETPTETQWIRFQVVDDETDAPVPGVTLKVKLPTGEVRDLTTDAEGMIDIRPVSAGTCDIQQMTDDAAYEVVEVI